MDISIFGKRITLFSHDSSGVKAYDASKWGPVRRLFAKVTGVYFTDKGHTYCLNRASLKEFLKKNSQPVENKNLTGALDAFLAKKHTTAILDFLNSKAGTLKLSDLEELFCRGFNIPKDTFESSWKGVDLASLTKAQFIMHFMDLVFTKDAPKAQNKPAEEVETWVRDNFGTYEPEITKNLDAQNRNETTVEPILDFLNSSSSTVKISDLKELFCTGFNIPEDRFNDVWKNVDLAKLNKPKFILCFMGLVLAENSPQPQNRSAQQVLEWVINNYDEHLST
ncbi:MAG: hypothetical protein JSR37_01550 [Verrucomicrobia bacterium]|nr:hypothetical protein [Verrucomicrobiota bacterium]